MKLIMFLLLSLSFGAIAQESLIFDINCSNSADEVKIKSTIDLETGKETIFKKYYEGEVGVAVVHIESDPEAIEEEGTVIEVFMMNQRGLKLILDYR